MEGIAQSSFLPGGKAARIRGNPLDAEAGLSLDRREEGFLFKSKSGGE